MTKQTSTIEKTATHSAHSHGDVENAAGPDGVAIAPPAAEWATLDHPLQAKLAVGPVNDKYEREADQIANQIMRMPAAGLQRQTCACGKPAGSDGMCADCQRNQRAMQRSADAGPSPTLAPPVVHEVLQQSGQPLNNTTRTAMEARFGADFSQVAVHADSQAAESARAVNARAYTVGRNIVFGTGQYAPNTSSGKHLLAHELTHVVQQSGQLARTVQRQPKPTAPTSASPGSPSCTPRTGMTEYGCYCGAGSSCGSGLTCAPANDLDACCQQHDIDYGGCSFMDRYNPFGPCYSITRAADAKLCSCAHGLAGRFHGASETYRQNVIRLFC